MLQILVSVFVLLIILGGLFAITLSRGEGNELKKSCGCALPGADSDKGSNCVNSCEKLGNFN